MKRTVFGCTLGLLWAVAGFHGCVMPGKLDPSVIARYQKEMSRYAPSERLGGRSECPKCGILYGANRKPKAAGKCDECGGPLKERSDDKDIDAIKQRLAAYHAEIKTLVDYYEWKGVLRRVDADATVEQVLENVLKAIQK